MAAISSIGSNQPISCREISSAFATVALRIVQTSCQHALGSFLTDANELRSGCAKTGNRMIVDTPPKTRSREVKRMRPPRRRRDARRKDLPGLSGLASQVPASVANESESQGGGGPFANWLREARGESLGLRPDDQWQPDPHDFRQWQRSVRSRTSGRSTCVRPGMTWTRRNSRKLSSSHTAPWRTISSNP